MTNAEAAAANRAFWDLWSYRLKVIGLTLPIATAVVAGGIKAVDLIVDAAEWRDAWTAQAKETNAAIGALKSSVDELPAIRKARDKEISDINTKLDRHGQAIDALATGTNDIKTAITNQGTQIAEGNSNLNRLLMQLLEPHDQHARSSPVPDLPSPRLAGAGP